MGENINPSLKDIGLGSMEPEKSETENDEPEISAAKSFINGLGTKEMEHFMSLNPRRQMAKLRLYLGFMELDIDKLDMRKILSTVTQDLEERSYDKGEEKPSNIEFAAYVFTKQLERWGNRGLQEFLNIPPEIQLRILRFDSPVMFNFEQLEFDQNELLKLVIQNLRQNGHTIKDSDNRESENENLNLEDVIADMIVGYLESREDGYVRTFMMNGPGLQLQFLRHDLNRIIQSAHIEINQNELDLAIQKLISKGHKRGLRKITEGVPSPNTDESVGQTDRAEGLRDIEWGAQSVVAYLESWGRANVEDFMRHQVKEQLDTLRDHLPMVANSSQLGLDPKKLLTRAIQILEEKGYVRRPNPWEKMK
jgi:hypothetical protein